MAAPDTAQLVFDPWGPPGASTAPTWSDAEVLLAVSIVGRLLLGDDWSESLADVSPGLHTALTMWTRTVVEPATAQPERAIARVRLVEAARAALRREVKEG